MDKQLLASQQEYLKSKLENSTVLIAGATGLIGSRIAYYLMDLNDKYEAGIKIIVLYRNAQKKNFVYSEALKRTDVEFIYTELENNLEINCNVDYIVHSAGISGGTKMHLKDPVKVFETSYNTAKILLDLAVEKESKGFVYVSSYEIYGTPETDDLIYETNVCNLDTMELRNIYAECKRFCESMCVAYSKKYGLNVYSGRLTSTFGTGVDYNDPRFFAEFARCIIENRDIVLKSTGGTVRSYLDSDDAAAAFLYILVNGENLSVYNLTNMESRISIKEMAEKAIDVSNSSIELKFDIAEDVTALGFRKESCTLMSSEKLMGIGWKPIYSIEDTLIKLIKCMRNE